MNKRKIFALSTVLLCGLLMLGGGVWAMSSANYAITRDVMGGGGEPMDSASYNMRSTLGQPAAETSLSANYRLGSGYWCKVPAVWNPWIYDEDSSDFIEIGELLAAISDYIGGDITISQLLEIINVYIGHTPKP